MHTARHLKVAGFQIFVWNAAYCLALALNASAGDEPAQADRAGEQSQVQTSLDDAVETYNVEVQAALDSLSTEVARQLDAAMKRGDLEMAKKLSLLEKEISESGKPSAEVAIKPAVDNARRKIIRASEKLAGQYEAAAKSLLKEGDLKAAEKLLTEKAEILAEMRAWRQPQQVQVQNGRASGRVAHARGVGRAYKSFRLVAMKSNPNGWEAYYREIQLFDAATGQTLGGGKASASNPPGDAIQQSTNAENAFDGDYETKYRTGMNPGVNQDWIGYEVENAVCVNRVTLTQINNGSDVNHVFWVELQGSNDGETWEPVMRAKSLQGKFDSAAAGAQVQWLK
jgi:hypothetical protein